MRTPLTFLLFMCLVAVIKAQVHIDVSNKRDADSEDGVKVENDNSESVNSMPHKGKGDKLYQNAKKKRTKRQDSSGFSATVNRQQFMENGMSLYKYGSTKVDAEIDGGSSSLNNQFGAGNQFSLDEKLDINDEKAGRTINLVQYFPFYGALYNYTIIDVNGLIRFGQMAQGLGNSFLFGKASNWPQNSDAAFMAPYLCRQVSTQNLLGPTGVPSGVYYRLILRSTLVNINYNNNPNRKIQCPSGKETHTRCGQRYDEFLDLVMEDLQQGIVGATAFRADMALVVTWNEVLSSVDREAVSNKAATYQLVWIADRNRQLSYVILNYEKLGFSAADVQGNTIQGRCQALFNGGNMTGSVLASPTERYKNNPAVMADDSAVPHAARGRYLYRVDDVVKRGGCSNKTGGTYPLLIYPDIVNLLGEMSVDVNGMCMTGARNEYALYITERPQGSCVRLNSAIARCSLPRVWNWGTKEVYFQLEGAGSQGEKAYVGYIYFVPPTLDPMALDIGNVYEWYENPMRSFQKNIKWFPRNFTDPRFKQQLQNTGSQSGQVNFNPADISMYATSLDLYVVGYAELHDEAARKFIPTLRTLAKLTTFNNRVTSGMNQWTPNSEILNLETINVEWKLSDWELRNVLYKFRVGYIKLAATPNSQADTEQPGLISPPIALHWLYTLNSMTGASNIQTSDEKAAYVQEIAQAMCKEWYHEDGRMDNFIRDTETNASCPCREKQAQMDFGRFMPHPRCSKQFRMLYCTSNLGSQNCYLSAQNVIQSQPTLGGGNTGTPAGQVCCYDNNGYLMHTSYQPVVQTMLDTPYSPGFPLRAYEFGTPPYNAQFRVPGLSTYHYDIMPYFFCCKWTKNHCQFFYWRRPSSGCQQYIPPSIGTVMGAGHTVTLDGKRFVFNAPGIFTLLHVPVMRPGGKEINIQIRLERYPDPTVDWMSRDVHQAEYLEPLQVTVVTGIALQEGDKDRVQVLARKDWRRKRYRTSIVVGGILRYFDNMWLQRYDGVTVYVNKVQQGQSDVYVVLEDSKIGVRIRESYGIDMSIRQEFQESLGLLDVELSLPPEYGVQSACDRMNPNPNPTFGNDQFGNPNDPNRPQVKGLLRPDPQDVTCQENQPIRVLDQGTRDNYIREYGVNTDPTRNFQSGQNRPETENLFRIDNKIGRAWSFEELVAGDIYQSAPMYLTSPNPNSGWQFKGISESDFNSMLTCWNNQPSGGGLSNVGGGQNTLGGGGNANPLAISAGRKKRALTSNADRFPNQRQPRGKGTACTVSLADVNQVCGQNFPCRWDYGTLYQRIIGENTRQAYIEFTENRNEAMKRYNSCAAMNIEYPEYLMMSPAVGAKYLEGNQIRYTCFQSHWIHGHDEYVCSRRWDGQYYYFEWNKGWQPWCRARSLEDTFKVLAAIFGILMILAIIGGIFLCCWCLKKKRLEERDEGYSYGQPMVNRAPQPIKKDIAVLEQDPTRSLKSDPYALRDTKPSYTPMELPDKRPINGNNNVALAGNGNGAPIIRPGDRSGANSRIGPPPGYDSMPRSQGSSPSMTSIGKPVNRFSAQPAVAVPLGRSRESSIGRDTAV